MTGKQRLVFLLSGLLAGAVNGYFGGGGGMLLVPAFTLLGGLDEKEALATSVAVILPLSLLSSAVYYFRGCLPLLEALPYLIGGLAGGLVGGLVFRRVSGRLMGRLLGAVIFFAGLRMVLA